MLKNKLMAVGAVIAGLLLPAPAMAQFLAYTDADLNLRVGPGTQYGIIDVIPYGDAVDVLGCLDGIEWCDVEWYGLRGWVSALYLVQPGTAYYLPRVAPQIGVPIIAFSFTTYHDRHYRDRPWYKKRIGRWRGRDWRRGERPRRREEADRPRQRQETERPRQRQETERPRRQRDTERPRQRQETERPRRQRQETERPRRQRDAEQPRRQRQQAEQPRQQRQQSDRPRQRERTERSRQERSGSRGRPEELTNNRGQ